MALLLKFQSDDHLSDEVGVLLREVNNIPTWTKKKHVLYSRILKLIRIQKYLFFSANTRTYGLSKSGERMLYDVPLGQQGSLSMFSGKRVRIICLGGGGGYGARKYCAKAISKKMLADNATNTSL